MATISVFTKTLTKLDKMLDASLKSDYTNMV